MVVRTTEYFFKHFPKKKENQGQFSAHLYINEHKMGGNCEAFLYSPLNIIIII